MEEPCDPKKNKKNANGYLTQTFQEKTLQITARYGTLWIAVMSKK